MSRPPMERDDLLHAIRLTLEFYGKVLDEIGQKFWLTTLGPEVPVAAVKRALKQHCRQSRYAPKPADVLELIAADRPRAGRTGPEPPWRSNCPADIAAAWCWFIGMVAAGGANEQLAGTVQAVEIDPDLQDRYLRVVNQEAARLSQPEAIPDEFKIPEIWGRAA